MSELLRVARKQCQCKDGELEDVPGLQHCQRCKTCKGWWGQLRISSIAELETLIREFPAKDLP